MDAPQILLKFGEASGTATANSGSVPAVTFSIVQGTEGVNWSRSASGSPYGNGRFQSLTGTGANAPYITTSNSDPGTILETINYAVGFRIASCPDGFGYIIRPALGSADGNAKVYADNFAGSTFDLHANFLTTSSGSTGQKDWTGLSTNTDYLLVGSIDVTTDTACVGRHKLNGVAEQNSTASLSTQNFEGDWPWLLTNSTHDALGFVGYYNLFAYGRGGNAWSSADLTSISADPTVLPGWSGPAVPVALMGQTWL